VQALTENVERKERHSESDSQEGGKRSDQALTSQGPERTPAGSYAIAGLGTENCGVRFDSS